MELWRALLQTQLTECANDIRQYDGLLWQIPATIGAIVGLVLNALGRNIFTGPVSGIDIAGVTIAALVTISLILALYKNRVFQITRGIYRKSIYRALLETNDKSPRTLVKPVLRVEDVEPCDVPGLVETSTKGLKELEGGILEEASKGAGPAVVRALVARRSAYITLLGVSNIVLLGEVLLLSWLLSRYV